MALHIGMGITFFPSLTVNVSINTILGTTKLKKKRKRKKKACVQDKALSRSARQIALVVSTAFSDYIVWYPKVLQREK